MIVYLDGDFVPATDARVSIWDGGFLYGDGIYTTLRTYAGRPVDLAAHHERLVRHARELELPLPVTLADLREVVARLVAANDLERTDGRLRITVSRGGDPDRPMPLTHLDRLAPTVLVTLGPVGDHLVRWQDEGIAVITLDAAFARGNFPTLKTLNSLATLRALRRAAAAGCPEAILTDPDGRLLEGAVSNLFLVCGEHLCTPAAGAGFLAGRTRQRIIELGRQAGIEIREKPLDQRHLAAACEVFMASSVREILPVVTVDGKPVAAGRVGPVTRRLQDRYRRALAADPGDA